MSLFVKIRRVVRRIPTGMLQVLVIKPGIYTTVFMCYFGMAKGGGVVSDKGIHMQKDGRD
ncbi:MAG: hypothetical protein AB8G05_12460 [Oligoflexales bacterium]